MRSRHFDAKILSLHPPVITAVTLHILAASRLSIVSIFCVSYYVFDVIYDPFSFHGKICLGVPSARQRYEILHTLMSEMEHALLEKDVQDLATATHGFVGADLAALCNEAALNCLREHVESKTCFGNTHSKPSIRAFDGRLGRNGTHYLRDNKDLSSDSDFEGASSSISEACISSDIPRDFTCMEQTDTLRITYKDFEKARMKIRPSAMREVCFTCLEFFFVKHSY